ncbi:serine/threonine-protein phosphatase 2A activator [Galendromus occidentalis]|uniref:Serine/threonine-protein phosphatase 2A activator n=1 Tax=Galendromus occidentalis TaxID=34638 RepID=A0AAJ6QQC1_9ACAR|nr:serine/threonine-protein phosphatase 2A activator [Galendromus occidentalis]
MAQVTVREIKVPKDIDKWLKSRAYDDYLQFVLAMNKATRGLNAGSEMTVSENVNKLLDLLAELDKLIDETPPISQPARFGNAAYRQWYQKFADRRVESIEKVLPESLKSRASELAAYYLDSFGNQTRIDYGTGHEMNFAVFLMCLFKIGFFTESDAPAVVCKIFTRYMRLVRKLQTVYRMEPAGSHGVWSLDDYQFLPFVWGSSQLVIDPPDKPNPEISEPCQFLNEDIPERYADDYLFMACIAYINSVKKGPFFEHSNQLYNASGTPSWQRLNEGLIRMYKNEVLCKFPIVQHMVFGELVSVDPAPPR